MPFQLSEQSVEALAQVISGGSANDAELPIGLYRQAWKLEAWFKRVGIPFTNTESRVPATRTAINLAIFLGDDCIKKIIEMAADPRDFISDPDRHNAVVVYLNKHLAFDGLYLEPGGRGMRLAEMAETSKASESLGKAASSFDFDTVQLDLERALRSAADDPEIAVTAACSLVESVCRSILAELEVPLPTNQDISGLYRAVREPLGLSPTKEVLSKDIVNDVKSALSGLITTIQSIGALRTHAGSAHGKERGFRRIDPRIAKLAVHAASAVALFLIETWQLRFPRRTLPKRG
jgi:hypothetical protein